jgi:hypothetical protein
MIESDPPPPSAPHAGAHMDFSRTMSYGDYLALDRLLDCQNPRSADHNELLFIIQHQEISYMTTERNKRRLARKLGGKLPGSKLTPSFMKTFSDEFIKGIYDLDPMPKVNIKGAVMSPPDDDPYVKRVEFVLEDLVERRRKLLHAVADVLPRDRGGLARRRDAHDADPCAERSVQHLPRRGRHRAHQRAVSPFQPASQATNNQVTAPKSGRRTAPLHAM